MIAETDSRIALGHDMAARAMAAARDAFRNPAVATHVKTPGDLLTEADLAIERMLRAAIADTFPDDHVLGEEQGGAVHHGGFSWLIDPIDGTVNFARGIGYFCVSLALVADGRVRAAWVADPVAAEVFFAGPAGPLLLNGAPVAPSTAPRDPDAPVLVGLGFSTRHTAALDARIVAALTASGMEFRRLGAGALCLAHVAAGRLDAYAEPHMNPWDGAGGLHLAAAAGAVTLDYCAAGGLAKGAPVLAAHPDIAGRLIGLLPAPFSGMPRTPDTCPADGAQFRDADHQSTGDRS